MLLPVYLHNTVDGANWDTKGAWPSDSKITDRGQWILWRGPRKTEVGTCYKPV